MLLFVIEVSSLCNLYSCLKQTIHLISEKVYILDNLSFIHVYYFTAVLLKTMLEVFKLRLLSRSISWDFFGKLETAIYDQYFISLD